MSQPRSRPKNIIISHKMAAHISQQAMISHFMQYRHIYWKISGEKLHVDS